MTDSPVLISLTFDDGLRCQFEQAMPILDRFRFRATFFLIANADPTHQQPNWPKINWRHEISGSGDVGAWQKPGHWHILNFHGIGDWGWSPISVAEFDRQMIELAEHRDAGVAEVVTFREGADRFRLGV